MLVIVMGVSGCGKTTLSKLFASKYGWRFIDADNYHSRENIDKMTNGIPLCDKDRMPWLIALHKVIQSWEEKGDCGIVACSALKESYRKILLWGNNEDNGKTTSCKKVLIVHLKGDKEVITKRLLLRNGHFMNKKLLDSQYEILEEPDDISETILSLSVENTVEQNANLIRQTLLNVFGLDLP